MSFLEKNEAVFNKRIKRPYVDENFSSPTKISCPEKNEAAFNTCIEQPYGDENLRSFIDKLRANDIDRYIDLPEIAVMGDTSSGKSSLLSALTQIQLPSNDQITTRCPLRLRMEKSDKVKATVGIKWHPTSSYKDNMNFATEEFETMSKVCETIEAAQKHILKLSCTEVAKDVIEVNVYGPSCTDLTLIGIRKWSSTTLLCIYLYIQTYQVTLNIV